MSWTDERIDRLKALWTEGNTASQIADDLGGVSRNAVIGKAHRLGLAARPSPVKAGEPKDKNKAVAVTEPVPVAPEPEPAPVAEEPEEQEEEQAEPAGIAPADAAGLDEPPATVTAPEPVEQPRVVSVGPGGFLRQGPGDQQAPIPPAPPRRLVPAKPSAEVSHKTSLLELNERICKWPIGHPGEPDFHFCGKKSNPGFPYCVDHCGVAYQAQLPRRDRRPPPPLPFGGPRIR
jgi:GcrA cell cycle regulator